MVYGAALERRFIGNGIEGSNPSPSAKSGTWYTIDFMTGENFEDKVYAPLTEQEMREIFPNESPRIVLARYPEIILELTEEQTEVVLDFEQQASNR